MQNQNLVYFAYLYIKLIKYHISEQIQYISTCKLRGLSLVLSRVNGQRYVFSTKTFFTFLGK